MRLASLLYPALLGIVCGGCFSDSKGSSGASTGTTTATSEATTSATTATATGTTTAGCPDGAAGCPCYGNGSCDDDLVCTSEVCLPPGCTPGVEGCPCMNGACLGQLVCDNGLCAQPAGTTTGLTTGVSTVGSTATTSGTSGSTGSTTGGGSGMYSQCVNQAACELVLPNGTCLFNEGATFGICTTTCADNNDCPPYVDEGWCTDIDGQLACVPRCTGNRDCPTGFSCAGGFCY